MKVKKEKDCIVLKEIDGPVGFSCEDAYATGETPKRTKKEKTSKKKITSSDGEDAPGSEKKGALVVNIAGAPGAGKSTCAAYVFSMLKMEGVNCELVTEFAKDKTWEDNTTALNDQLYMLGQQNYRLRRCADKVDVIISDSPLFLNILYNKRPELGKNFDACCMDVFNSYNNINFFLERVKKYNPVGRKQSESESDEIAGNVFEFMKYSKVPFKTIKGDLDGCNEILSIIFEKISEMEIDFASPESEDSCSTHTYESSKYDDADGPVTDALKKLVSDFERFGIVLSEDDDSLLGVIGDLAEDVSEENLGMLFTLTEEEKRNLIKVKAEVNRIIMEDKEIYGIEERLSLNDIMNLIREAGDIDLSDDVNDIRDELLDILFD